jgi:hypothetical protein
MFGGAAFGRRCWRWMGRGGVGCDAGAGVGAVFRRVLRPNVWALALPKTKYTKTLMPLSYISDPIQ